MILSVKTKPSKWTPFPLRVDPVVEEYVRREAYETRTSMNTLINQLCREALENRRKAV